MQVVYLVLFSRFSPMLTVKAGVLFVVFSALPREKKDAHPLLLKLFLPGFSEIALSGFVLKGRFVRVISGPAARFLHIFC